MLTWLAPLLLSCVVVHSQRTPPSAFNSTTGRPWGNTSRQDAPPPRLELWRLPGLDDAFTYLPTMRKQAAALAARGFKASNASNARSYHKPTTSSKAHTALHPGVGYISLNYTAGLHPDLVHLDEFAALLRELNASWECAAGPSGTTLNTLRLASPPNASSLQDAGVVVAYLAGRLAAPNATLAWGPALLDMGAQLWGASCDAPLVNRSTEPFFQVHSVGVQAGSSAGSLALTMLLEPCPPLRLFSHIKMATRVLGNETRARREFPQAPSAPQGRRSLAPNPDPTLTGTGNQVTTRYVVSAFKWNYASPGVASVSPKQLLSGVPATALGCVNCYVNLDLSVYASLDFCSPTGSALCYGTYLREVGAYFEGVADVKGTFKLDNPSLASSSTTTLMAKASAGSLTFSVAGLPLTVYLYFELNAAVSATGSVKGKMSYAASYYQQVDFGAAYNYKKANSNTIYPINQFGSPTTSAPAPDFSGILDSDAEVQVALRPKVYAALWNIVSVYAQVSPRVTLTTATTAAACQGLKVSVAMDVSCLLGMDAITWASILAATGMSSSWSSYLYGTVIQAYSLPSFSVIDQFNILTPLCIQGPTATPSPTSTKSLSSSSTPGGTASSTPTVSDSSSASASASQSPVPSDTSTPTPSPSASPTQSPSGSASPTASPSGTDTPSDSPSASASPSQTQSDTPSETPSASASPSQTASATPTQTQSDTTSGTPSISLSATLTGSATPTSTPSGTGTATGSPTPTASRTARSTPSPSGTPTTTASATRSRTGSPTSTVTASPSLGASATPTPSAPGTRSSTASITLTSTGTGAGTPSSTPSSTGTGSDSSSGTVSTSPTSTLTASGSGTVSAASTPSATATPSLTVGASPSATPSNTPTRSFSTSTTASATPSVTPTSTLSASPTATALRTPTATGTRSTTSTGTPSLTTSRTPTSTSSVGATPSGTASGTASLTVSGTGTPTVSGTPSSTGTPTPTASSSLSLGASPSKTATLTPSTTGTASVTGTGSGTRTSTRTPTASLSSGASPSATASNSLYPSSSPSQRRSPTNTPTPSGTSVASGLTPSGSASLSSTPSTVLTPQLALSLQLSLPRVLAPSVEQAFGEVFAASLQLDSPPLQQQVSHTPAGGGGAAYTFTVFLPLGAQLQSGRLRRRLVTLASPSDASDLIADLLTNGNLAAALADAGLAGDMGFDSADELLLAAASAPTAALVVPSVTATPTGTPSPTPSSAALSAAAQESSTAAVTGAAVGGAVGVLALIGTLVYIVRRRRAGAAVRAAAKELQVEPAPEEDPQREQPASPDTDPPQLHLEQLQERGQQGQQGHALQVQVDTAVPAAAAPAAAAAALPFAPNDTAPNHTSLMLRSPSPPQLLPAAGKDALDKTE